MFGEGDQTEGWTQHDHATSVIWSTQQFVDTLNHKFDEMILIMEETFDTLKE